MNGTHGATRTDDWMKHHDLYGRLSIPDAPQQDLPSPVAGEPLEIEGVMVTATPTLDIPAAQVTAAKARRFDLPPDDDPDDPPAGGAPVSGPKPPPNGSPPAGNRPVPRGRNRPKTPKSRGLRPRVTDYQYRYYDSVTGRWLSRDPIGDVGGPTWFDAQEMTIETMRVISEMGHDWEGFEVLLYNALFRSGELIEGPNLNVFVRNDPVDYRDALGLALDPASRLAIQLAAAGKSAKEIAEMLCALGLTSAKEAARIAAKELAKNAKRLSEKELKKRVKDVHKLKEKIKKEYGKELGKDKNFDILEDANGNVLLKGNKTGNVIATDTPLTGF